MFAGSLGHTYGHRSFIAWIRRGETFKYGAHIPWYESLDAPGANQMRHLRTLMESQRMLNHVPDATLLADEQDQGNSYLQATRSLDGSVAMVYSPLGKAIPVRMEKLQGTCAEAKWFDPRTGGSTPCGTVETRGTHSFQPPGSGEDQDWVLVLQGQ